MCTINDKIYNQLIDKCIYNGYINDEDLNLYLKNVRWAKKDDD